APAPAPPRQSACAVTFRWPSAPRPPEARIPASPFLPSSSSPSPTTTAAPSWTNSCASTAPCPRAPPLISATLPASLPMAISSVWRCGADASPRRRRGQDVALGVWSAPPHLTKAGSDKGGRMAQATLPPWIQTLRQRTPEFADSYMAQRERILRDGAIPAKYKHLMTMIVDALLSHPDGVATIANRARSAGASEAEIQEAVEVAYL